MKLITPIIDITEILLGSEGAINISVIHYYIGKHLVEQTSISESKCTVNIIHNFLYRSLPQTFSLMFP